MHNNPTDDVEVRYSHIIKVITDWIDTTNLVVVGGRGLAKSTVIQARRSADCVYDMPGAPLAFVGNTYTNLRDNIMPAVKTGWELWDSMKVCTMYRPAGHRNPGAGVAA